MTNGDPPKVGEFVQRVGKLVLIEDVTPPQRPVLDYIFESITARSELRLRGKTIDVRHSYCNWSESEEGVAAAIDEMKQYALDNQIGPDSDLELVVVRVAEQCRMRPNPRQKWEVERCYGAFRALALGCKCGLPEPVETVAWSSRHPDGVPEKQP